MATYPKTLKSIAIKTSAGTTVSAADTATDPIASNALYEFEHFQTMHIKGEENVTLIPFHAVDSIVVTTTSTTVEGTDPYGCEEESGNGEDAGEGGNDGE